MWLGCFSCCCGASKWERMSGLFLRPKAGSRSPRDKRQVHIHFRCSPRSAATDMAHDCTSDNVHVYPHRKGLPAASIPAEHDACRAEAQSASPITTPSHHPDGRGSHSAVDRAMKDHCYLVSMFTHLLRFRQLLKPRR